MVNAYVNNYYDEGLLYIRTNSHDGVKKNMKKYLIEKSQRINKNVEEAWLKQISLSDRIFKTPELYAKVLVELEQRKAANTKILRSYGLDL